MQSATMRLMIRYLTEGWVKLIYQNKTEPIDGFKDVF